MSIMSITFHKGYIKVKLRIFGSSLGGFFVKGNMILKICYEHEGMKLESLGWSGLKSRLKELSNDSLSFLGSGPKGDDVL